MKRLLALFLLSVPSAAQFDPCGADSMSPLFPDGQFDLMDDVDFEIALDAIQYDRALVTGAIEFAGFTWRPWDEWDVVNWRTGSGFLSNGLAYIDQPLGGWYDPSNASPPQLGTDWVEISILQYNLSNPPLTPCQQQLMRKEVKAWTKNVYDPTFYQDQAQWITNWDSGFASTSTQLQTARSNAYNHRAAGNSCSVIFDFYRSTCDNVLGWWEWYARSIGWDHDLENFAFETEDLNQNPNQTQFGYTAEGMTDIWFDLVFNYYPVWASQQTCP